MPLPFVLRVCQVVEGGLGEQSKPQMRRYTLYLLLSK